MIDVSIENPLMSIFFKVNFPYILVPDFGQTEYVFSFDILLRLIPPHDPFHPLDFALPLEIFGKGLRNMERIKNILIRLF